MNDLFVFCWCGMVFVLLFGQIISFSILLRMGVGPMFWFLVVLIVAGISYAIYDIKDYQIADIEQIQSQLFGIIFQFNIKQYLTIKITKS